MKLSLYIYIYHRIHHQHEYIFMRKCNIYNKDQMRYLKKCQNIVIFQWNLQAQIEFHNLSLFYFFSLFYRTAPFFIVTLQIVCEQKKFLSLHFCFFLSHFRFYKISQF